jgi:hypothetical protein
MMRSRAVIMHMVSGKTPSANLPQGTIVFIVIGRVLVTFEAVWEGSGRSGPLTFLTRKVANVSLRNCSTFEAVTTIFIDPL